MNMKKIIRSDKEIEKEITRICEENSNFITDNYGSEAADNGKFEIYYSEYSAKNTMNTFVKWLLGK